MVKPVAPRRIKIAQQWGLVNADVAAVACRRAGIPYAVACALLQKESGGRNVYGHDTGGVFSRDEHPEVTAANYLDFLVRVMNGALSNGVGPCQITYAGSSKNGHRDGGYFREMAADGLLPWVPLDNMVKGFSILRSHYERTGSWNSAGDAYNGRDSYGDDLAVKITEWTKRLA